MGTRKVWSLEEKFSLVLRVLQGGRSVADICREQGVAPTQFYRWRDAFLEGAKQGLTNKRNLKNRDPLLQENRHLKQLLAEQLLINDLQKNSTTSATTPESR